MKPVLKAGLLIAALISFLAATAQTVKKTEANKKFEARISAQFGRTLSQLGKIEISQPSEVKKVASQKTEDDLSTDLLRSVQSNVEAKKQLIETKQKEYIPSGSNRHSIDKDLLPLLAGIPEPIANLQDAKKVMKGKYEETPFAIYIEKLKRYQAQMEEVARQSIPDYMKDPVAVKAAAYKNAAKAQESINNNPVIQEMGGIEKLKNMTPGQREALAKQMTEKIKQNPSAYTGSEGDPRKAFTQKMMKDPAYAARYNKMTDQQKQEEYQLFIQENGFTQQTTQADRVSSLAERDKAVISIAIEEKLAHIRKHSDELARIVGDAQLRTDEYFRYVNEKLNNEYAARVAALPIVEHGEAGSGKDTYPVDIAYQIVLYPVNAQNALANKQVWKRHVDMLKVIIAEYNEFFSEFWGRDKLTDQIMHEKLAIPAGIIAGMCGEMIRFTQMASFQTNQNGGWQSSYNEKVLHLYE